MLLVLDVGNTNITIGVYDGDVLAHQWRLGTRSDSTADELAVAIHSFFDLADLKFKKIKGVIISSVVPSMEHALISMVKRYIDFDPLIVSHVNAGIQIKYPNPSEIGADRLVNAVAAFEKFKTSCIIIDFGTATTFDYVDADGAYCGGAITPGIKIANEALYRWAAKLPRVDVFKTDNVVAKSTVEAMQAGVFHGYVGMVEHLIDKMKNETGKSSKVVATGGISSLIASEVRSVDVIERFLTLDGLKLIWERNRA